MFRSAGQLLSLPAIHLPEQSAFQTFYRPVIPDGVAVWPHRPGGVALGYTLEAIVPEGELQEGTAFSLI